MAGAQVRSPEQACHAAAAAAVPTHHLAPARCSWHAGRGPRRRRDPRPAPAEGGGRAGEGQGQEGRRWQAMVCSTADAYPANPTCTLQNGSKGMEPLGSSSGASSAARASSCEGRHTATLWQRARASVDEPSLHRDFTARRSGGAATGDGGDQPAGPVTLYPGAAVPVCAAKHPELSSRALCAFELTGVTIASEVLASACRLWPALYEPFSALAGREEGA